MGVDEKENAKELAECRERVIETFRKIWGNNYKAAEAETGVPAAKWKRLCNRAQFPTFEMVFVLGRTRPYFLLWILTGSADTYFQTSPHDRWQDKLARALGVDVDKRRKADTE